MALERPLGLETADKRQPNGRHLSPLRGKGLLRVPALSPSTNLAGLTEAWLRELADTQIDALDESAALGLEATVDVEKMARSRRLSHGVTVEAPGHVGLEPSEFSRFVAEAQERAELSLVAHRETNPDADGRPYQAAIVLLVLADLHAGDGVVDGRFASLAAGRV